MTLMVHALLVSRLNGLCGRVLSAGIPAFASAVAVARAQPALPDLPGPGPAEPLPSAPIAPGHEPVEGEAYITLMLLILIAALLTLAIMPVLIAAWRGLTGARKGDEPEWLAIVALAGAAAIMYVFSEPMFALISILAEPLWLAIFIPFLLIAIAAILGLVGHLAGSIIEEGWESIVGWCVFIATVLTLNRYFDWDIWWSLAGAFAAFTAVGLVAFALHSILKSRD